MAALFLVYFVATVLYHKVTLTAFAVFLLSAPNSVPHKSLAEGSVVVIVATSVPLI